MDLLKLGETLANAGGWTAFVVLVVVVGVTGWRAITKGILMTGASHDAIVKVHLERESDLEEELDAWKTLAQGSTPELKRLNDLLDAAIRLLLDRRPNQ